LTRVESLDDCRYVAVSPLGEWLATGSHNLGTQVWRASDAKKEADLPVRMVRWLAFSPDGKWLMTGSPPCRLWSTGTWALARELGGGGLCFSPDGRLIAVLDASQIICLVEAETGRVIARLERPEPSNVILATFSPDGSRLVLVPENYPAMQVWDLRAIRKRLAGMGLDWDAPALSDDAGAPPSVARLPSLQVDLGPKGGEIEHLAEAQSSLLSWCSARLNDSPSDAEAYHLRGHALFQLGRLREALDDFNVAYRLRPDDAHLRATLADCCNQEAWGLVKAPGQERDAERAVDLARRAVELAPNEIIFENTLGVALYRANRYAEAIENLERNLVRSGGDLDGFDLFFPEHGAAPARAARPSA
jgi:hypothetical protein